MGKNKYVSIPDESEYEPNLDAHIARLREILLLMAPESGSQALGALREHAPDVPLAARIKAINGHRH